MRTTTNEGAGSTVGAPVTRYLLVLVASALISVLAACSPAADAGETTGDSASSASGNTGLVVGDTATATQAGNTLTVLSYESPISPAEGSEPGGDSELSAIEVEACASSSSGRDEMSVSQNAFVLRMPGGARVRSVMDGSEVETEEPVLRTMDPKPGQCERGLVVFRTPLGERPEAAVFEDQFTTETTSIEWAILDE